jgi:glyoxylase-like metal-dependent hydrolase (beta-lactamase superfamily II)
LIFAGDAAKNQAELATGKVDMTLDPSASRASIDRLRSLAAEDPANIIVCGHDRLLGLSEERLVHHAELTAAVSARLSPDFEEETVIDLVSAERAVRASGADTNLVP